jgi:hypothetical protein
MVEYVHQSSSFANGVRTSQTMSIASLQTRDYMGFLEEPALVKLLGPGERLLFADKLKKINQYEWS